jgi:S1-C subfamily serine protease
MNDLPVDGTDPPLTDDVASEPSAPEPEPNERVAPPIASWSPAGSEPIEGVVAAPSTNDAVAVDPPSTAVYTAPAIVDQVPLSSQPSPSPAKKSLWSTRLSLLLVAALVGGLAGHYASSSSGSGGVTIQGTNNTPGSAYLPGGISIPKLIDKVLPSIVSIDVKGQGFEDQGTGMIITKNGLVVTNNHVIAAAATSGTITVTRTGSTKALPATLIGTNPIDDVALVRIDNVSGLTPVTFGNSNALVVGDSVIAIGNALGLAAGTPTVTSGIVSALGRTVTAGDSAASTETLNNMIQTDAAINPGNSGGPLLDSSGDVIGMNTAVAGTLPDGTSAQNIGFAIPDATIETLLKQLKAGESVVNHGAFIGVEITSLTAALKTEYGFSVNAGAVVLSVISGTGAATAGVKQGDVIVGINSTTINGAQDVSSVISALRPGDVVTLHIVRGKHHIVIKVTLGTQPAS